ncbi:MAG: IPT/TIG domain-containing protein, partial [Bryobacterales bacterium]|nr:IPT/TIG domain-containing protein [Bryobacterales bacterium]
EASRLTTVASDLTTLYGPRRHDTYSPYTGANCVISSTVYPKSTIAMSEDYLKAQFLAMGYEASAITLEEVPQGVGHNVYVTKTGSLYPNVFLEVGAHYDTINGSPGGSDNAAAVALVVELARVLKDYPSRYSIRFALWVAEEYDSQRGAYFGSTYHVQQALARGEQIKAGLNSDVIGWADPGSPTYYMNEVSYLDAESERIANLFQKAAADYGIAIGFRKNRAILPSDQWAYWNQNLPAVVSMGGWLTGHPNYHGCGDTAANIDFVNVLRTTQQNLVVLLWLDAEGNTSASTTTSLESTPNPSLAGQSVTLTAAVRAAVGTASGTVEFREGAVSLGTALLNASGVAAMTTSSLAVGTHSLTAVYGGDQSHDGSTSVPLTHSVYLSGSPAPAISSLAPGSVIAGGAAFSLTVTGGNFVANSVVRWNGAERATTYVSASELRATIPAADIAAPGSALVSVFTPAPGGGASAALTLAITNPQAAPAGVLLAAYNMDEGGGAVLHDRSGNANDGSLLNGVAWTTGRYGTAISLDGVNDYVQMPNSPALELSGKNLTLEFWANVQSGGTAWDYVILNKPWNSGQMNYPYYQYGVEFYGSSREFVFFFGGAFGYREFRMAASYDTWHHVAFTYDGSNVRGYLNGVQRFSTPETESLTVRGTNLLLGVDGQLQQPFKGRLDDLRIYSRALSAAEIQADMNTPVASAGAPAITGFSPTSGPAGTVVTISGSGFTGATAVRFNGVNAQAFTVVSDSEITATVPAAAGTGAVSVVAPGGTVQSAGVFTFVTAPAIGSLSPSQATAGGASFVLTVTGENFVPSSVVRWNGADRGTTFVSGTQLQASIPASDITTAGAALVSVHTPTAGGGTSGTLVFTIGNPVPSISSLSPTSTAAGGPSFTLTVSGAGFVSGSTVRWKGEDRPTTFESATRLTATISGADIAGSGTAAVTVFTPAPGGGTSASRSFTINNPVPAIVSLNPSSVAARGPAFTLTVTGSGFVPTSVVRWNSSNRTTTYVSPTQLTAAITSSDIARATTAQITVRNPTPGGGTSNAVGLTVRP